MESVRALSGIASPTRVQDRSGGGKRQADAFRRALQQEAGEQAAGREAGGEAERPVRTALQRRPPVGRRDDGETSRHVDVLA